MRAYLVVLLAAAGIACGKAAPPTAPSSGGSQATTGFFTSGHVQLSCQLDVPAHSAPVGAVVFGHGSGMATKSSCRVFGLADGFLARGYTRRLPWIRPQPSAELARDRQVAGKDRSVVAAAMTLRIVLQKGETA